MFSSIDPVQNIKWAARQDQSGLLKFARLGIVVTLGIAMLFRDGEIVMRILSKPQLKELVLYSPQHVARLEKAGLFPKRVQLGPNRVGWVEDEVLDWLQTRMEGREEA